MDLKGDEFSTFVGHGDRSKCLNSAKRTGHWKPLRMVELVSHEMCQNGCVESTQPVLITCCSTGLEAK
jgi:hypothetical protein